MNDDIRRLVRLQDIAFQTRELEAAEGGLPDRLAGLEQVFAQRIEEIGSARLRHESLVQQQRKLTTERDELAVRLKAAQQKLMQVSNQREYSAVLNEIDSYKTTVGSLEEKILDCEGQIEQLAAPAAEADARIEEERLHVEASKQQLSQDIAQSSERLAELIRQRDEIARTLPPDLVRRFESILRARGGIAIARVEKESCGACHVRLRPQVINTARRGDEIITCDSCRRILYVEDAEPDAEGQNVAANHRAQASQ